MKKNDLDTALENIMEPISHPTESAPGPRGSDFKHLPTTTTTISFRVRTDEKKRIEEAIKRRTGESLAGGLKKILYAWLNEENEK